MEKMLKEVRIEVGELIDQCVKDRAFDELMAKDEKMFEIIMYSVRDANAYGIEKLSAYMKEDSPEYSKKFLELSRKVKDINNARNIFNEGISLIEKAAKAGYKEAKSFIFKMNELEGTKDNYNAGNREKSNTVGEFKDLFVDKEDKDIKKNKEIKGNKTFNVRTRKDEDDEWDFEYHKLLSKSNIIEIFQLSDD